jgi:NADPH:quinone reductase-like Zn-dependent oxidoreductase
VVGYEVSGVVDRVGSGVDPARMGTEVVALTRFGGYSEAVCVPTTQAHEKPATITHEQAAALPVAYVTAWQLLVVMGSLKPGETVLIHNAGGGVGLAAIDVARHLGATIYGTASRSKHAFLTERGVHHLIDYRATDWTAEVDRLTAGKGVSLVIDPFGGTHVKKSYRALRASGRLGMFGISSATTSRLPGPLRLGQVALGMPIFHPVGLMNANRSVFGVNLGHMWHETEMIAGWVETLLDGVAQGWVRPHVDRTFPLGAAGEAHAYIEERRNLGKVVLTT